MNSKSTSVAPSLRIPREQGHLPDLTPKLSQVPGWRSYSSGNLHAAFHAVAAAVTRDKNDGRAWELMGLVLRDLGKPKSAVSALETASLLVPMHPLSQICLAECYAVIGKRRLARDLYLSQRQIVQESVQLLLLVAAGLEGIDEPHLAMETCRQASAVDPDSGQVHYDMCFYASRCGSRVSVVENLAWRAVELEPGNVHFRVGLASLLVRLERFDKAHWVVSKLTVEQINQVTCKCCLARIQQLYIDMADEERSQWCHERLVALGSN